MERAIRRSVGRFVGPAGGRVSLLVTLLVGLGGARAESPSALGPLAPAAHKAVCERGSRSAVLAILPQLVRDDDELPVLSCSERVLLDYRPDMEPFRQAYLHKLVRLAPRFAAPFLPPALFSSAEKDSMAPILAAYDRHDFRDRHTVYRELCGGRVPGSRELAEACARHRRDRSLIAQLRDSDLLIESLTADERESLAGELRAAWERDGALWERRFLRRGLCVRYRPRTAALRKVCATIASEQADLPVWNAHLQALAVRRVQQDERSDLEGQLWLGLVLSGVALLTLVMTTVRQQRLEAEREARQRRWAQLS
jgi:hypothetical protein